MTLPEFTVAIWLKPHRGYGYYAEVDASDVDDGLPGGVLQSFELVTEVPRYPELQPDCPFREFSVSGEQIRQLLLLADQIDYSFAEHRHTPMLGGSYFGIRVSRGFHEATIVWHGRLEDQESGVRELYASIQSLAQA